VVPSGLEDNYWHWADSRLKGWPHQRALSLACSDGCWKRRQTQKGTWWPRVSAGILYNMAFFTPPPSSDFSKLLKFAVLHNDTFLHWQEISANILRHVCENRFLYQQICKTMATFFIFYLTF
jgi:hypothetical protein